MLSRAEKEAIVSRIKDDIGKAQAIFLTNLIGIASNDANEIRKQVRDANGNIVITRNTLLTRAAEGTSAEAILKDLKGPTAVAFAFEDAVGVAKALYEAGKKNEVIDLKVGLLEGRQLSQAELKELAQLPSKDEMLATLLATFNAPISAFTRLMNSIKDKMEEQGVEAPSALVVTEEKLEE